jgi:hypothetical protein
MESDRKYKSHGYMDAERSESRPKDRSKPGGPRPSIDITGPRLPRMVQTVTASRCFNCGTALAQGADFKGNCPKCNAALHCCKQCAHFEPSTRFQCRKPIQVRIAVKDHSNECALFSPRVTVARDGANQPPVAMSSIPVPKTASDARAAFDQLFKK